MPDRFGKRSGPSWRTCLVVRYFLGVVHSVLKQAMMNTENRKQPISVSNFQEFGETKEMGQDVQHSSVSRTEGEALEATRGAHRA